MRAEEPLLLKDLINFLFANVLHPDGRPYITQEVADHVRISHATINQLRTGRNKNPSVPTLLEVGRFFNVPLSFFNCHTYEECYAVLNIKNPDITVDGYMPEITYRISKLSPETQKFLLNIISWAEAAEREQREESQDI